LLAKIEGNQTVIIHTKSDSRAFSNFRFIPESLNATLLIKPGNYSGIFVKNCRQTNQKSVFKLYEDFANNFGNFSKSTECRGRKAKQIEAYFLPGKEGRYNGYIEAFK